MRIAFKGSRKELVDRARQLVGILAGQGDDASGVRQGFLMAIGHAALDNIHDAFVTKSRGGTDAAGKSWPPLSPTTIARRRVSQQEERRNPAIKNRMKIVRREERKLYKRLIQSMGEREARSEARRRAEYRASVETGKTKVQTLGGRDVEILRDIGNLLNSITPGIHSEGSSYVPPHENQVFELKDAAVVVGTNVPYAAVHQSGSKHIPQRAIFPVKAEDIPQVWWDNWMDAGILSIQASAARHFSA